MPRLSLNLKWYSQDRSLVADKISLFINHWSSIYDYQLTMTVSLNVVQESINYSAIAVPEQYAIGTGAQIAVFFLRLLGGAMCENNISQLHTFGQVECSHKAVSKRQTWCGCTIAYQPGRRHGCSMFHTSQSCKWSPHPPTPTPTETCQWQVRWCDVFDALQTIYLIY